MSILKTIQEIQMFNKMAQFYRYFIKILPPSWHLSQSYLGKLRYLNAQLNIKPFGKTTKVDTFKFPL